MVGHFSHGCKLEDCIGFHGEENRQESSAWNVTAGAVAAIGPTRVFSASFGVRLGYGSTLQFKCVALKNNKLLELSSPVFLRHSRGTFLLGAGRELDRYSRPLLSNLIHFGDH